MRRIAAARTRRSASAACRHWMSYSLALSEGLYIGKGKVMPGGKAHGPNREYQVRCRDVLVFREPGLIPYVGADSTITDGIDVTIALPDTTWSLDVALRRHDDESLILAECRRRVHSVKQADVGSFARIVELARKTLGVSISGVFIAKTDHQIGAVRVGEYEGIQIVILDENAEVPGFNIRFLRYDREREARIDHYVMHSATGIFAIGGNAPVVQNSTPPEAKA
jgi:hypothetical protein